MMVDVFIAAATRTPFGRYGGRLAALRCDDLAAAPMTALMSRYPNVDWAAVDEVMLGCANQAGEDNRNVARMADVAVWSAGNSAGGDGESTVRFWPGSNWSGGAHDRLWRGGVGDCWRRRKYVALAVRHGQGRTAFGREQKLEDTTLGWHFINPAMQSRYGVDSMTQTADNLAREHGITRDCQDAYAWRSQQRTAHAQAQGWLAEEITSVQVLQWQRKHHR